MLFYGHSIPCVKPLSGLQQKDQTLTHDKDKPEHNVVRLAAFRDQETVEIEGNSLTVFTVETDDPDASDFSISFDVDGAHLWQHDEYIYLTDGQVDALMSLMVSHMVQGADEANDN